MCSNDGTALAAVCLGIFALMEIAVGVVLWMRYSDVLFAERTLAAKLMEAKSGVAEAPDASATPRTLSSDEELMSEDTNDNNMREVINYIQMIFENPPILKHSAFHTTYAPMTEGLEWYRVFLNPETTPNKYLAYVFYLVYDIVSDSGTLFIINEGRPYQIADYFKVDADQRQHYLVESHLYDLVVPYINTIKQRG